MTTDLVEADAAEFRRIVEVDWIYANECRRLHAPADSAYEVEDWTARDVTMACGWRVAYAFIPGFGSRLGLPRCSHCCDKLGLPRGVGSPKNDKECRIILGIPCTKPQRPYDGPMPIPVCTLPTGHDGEHVFRRDVTE